MQVCFKCGYKLNDSLEVFRSTDCPECRKPLKVCRNCRFYSPGAKWDCHETIDEQVKEKENANFCSYFSFIKIDEKDGIKKVDFKENSRNAFDKLFGNED